jgi:type VI secretion system protein ImpA
MALDKAKSMLSAGWTEATRMIVAEELLIPISEESPCGEDLSYDAGLQEMELLARGKPETQFSPAESPDWKKVRAKCLELFARSKDLRIALTLTVAMLELEGLDGFREGLSLMKGLLEQFWPTVYPQLDPADDNDPLLRMNIVASLATPVGAYGDPIQVLERLRRIPLCNSIRMGRFSLRDILRAESGPTSGEDKEAPTMSQIDAAFRGTDPQELAGNHQNLGACLVIVREIDESITNRVGASKAPDLSLLPSELLAMQRRIAPYLPADDALRAKKAAAEPGSAVEGTSAATGEIRTREDVVKLLEKICEYYGRTEPSSPVPLILKRAARLAEMNFMEIINDMSPDSISQIRTITGEAAPE